MILRRAESTECSPSSYRGQPYCMSMTDSMRLIVSRVTYIQPLCCAIRIRRVFDEEPVDDPVHASIAL